MLITGKLPENEKECAVEEEFLTANKKNIGDKITVEVEQISNDEGEKKEVLKQKEMTIVGTVRSPLYISRDRGTTNLGSGKINYYLYINKENINVPEIYTAICVKVDTDEVTSSKKYEDKVNEVKEKIENEKETRQKARYDSLINKSTQKVEEAQEKLDDEKKKATEKIEEAQADIDSGKNEIAKQEDVLNKSENQANKKFREADNQFKNAKNEIKQNENNLVTKEQEAETKFKQLEQQKAQLQGYKKQLENEIKQLEQQISEINQKLQNPSVSEQEKAELESTKTKSLTTKQEYISRQTQIIMGIEKINTGIEQGRNEIAKGKEQIKQAKIELDKKQNELNTAKKQTRAKINNGRNELQKAKSKIADGEAELNKNKEEFETKIQDAERQLIDARTKINDIKQPKWYVLDRSGNIGYNGFIQDTKSIANIGKIFPIVFFVVATLISLTSMTRMVEEQRVQIGTLKALGYNKRQIAGKYILYASLACIIGGILGMCVGFVILPKIIWMMYEMMYKITDIKLNFNILYGGIGLLLISICIIGATIYTVMKELVQTPATLMRPKAPKMGKRVLLEKIPFIWNKLNFSKKVTVRNIFRYKKRFLMTIIGICGCTSLILAGFGIKDSISRILPIQFNEVHHYDMQINLKNGLEDKQKDEYISKLNESNKFSNITQTYINSSKVTSQGKEEEVQIIIPKESIEDAITIRDAKTKEKLELKDDMIYITDKVAQLLGVKQGDKITLKDNDDNEKEVTVSAICENYIYHYIYMTKPTYEKLYEKKYETNVLLANYNNINSQDEESLAKEIMRDKEVASTTRISVMEDSLNDMMKSLNYVVIVLIVSAGLLAFVVLYNLSNVNISERIRELATIKVLGFYDKEVYNYVTRETVLLTLIGIIGGLIGGFFLNYFIIGTCEIDMLRFVKVIRPISYVYSVVITITFTLIVNIATYFALKKIDMIESLKSVE